MAPSCPSPRSRPGRGDPRGARRGRGGGRPWRGAAARGPSRGLSRLPVVGPPGLARGGARRATPRAMPGRWCGGGRSTSTGSTPGSAPTASTRRARSPRGPGRALIGRRRPRSPRSTRCWPGSAPPSPCAARPATMPAPTISAAIATSTMPPSRPRRRSPPARRVAILDVDYHHGNGTQDIFYARGDVLFVSIHADPRTDYPFFWGHADETGEGRGRGRDAEPAAAARHRSGRLSAGARSRRWSGSPRFAPGPARLLLRRRHLRRRSDLPLPAGDARLCRARPPHRRRSACRR